MPRQKLETAIEFEARNLRFPQISGHAISFEVSDGHRLAESLKQRSIDHPDDHLRSQCNQQRAHGKNRKLYHLLTTKARLSSYAVNDFGSWSPGNLAFFEHLSAARAASRDG